MTLEKFRQEIIPLKHVFFRYALSIVYNREMAEDIVQDVFMKLWMQRHKLDQIRNKEAWGIRCIRNLTIDKYRAQKVHPVELQAVSNYATGQDEGEDILEHKDLLETVKKLMSRLPEKQREIFRLRDLLGYTNREIQDLLNLDASQVKVNLFRVRKKIKIALTEKINYGL